MRTLAIILGLVEFFAVIVACPYVVGYGVLFKRGPQSKIDGAVWVMCSTSLAIQFILGVAILKELTDL